MAEYRVYLYYVIVTQHAVLVPPDEARQSPKPACLYFINLIWFFSLKYKVKKKYFSAIRINQTLVEVYNVKDVSAALFLNMFDGTFYLSKSNIK